MRPYLLIATACLLAAPTLLAQSQPNGARGEALPSELEGVGVTEHLGDQIPLDTHFIDENGQPVTLAKYFGDGRPVILNLGYLSCPMLCGLVANGMIDAMLGMDQTVGEEFRVLSVSIDHTETAAMAKDRKQDYLARYDRPAAAQGWNWLTGREDQIRRLTDAVGFGFRWNPDRNEFAHAAVLIILSPDGRVMRYLYGVQFDPRTMELSLIEAADGKTGSSLDKILLFCFHYDAETGRYGPAARNIMKAGGALTVLVILGLILGFRYRERKRT